MEYEQKQIIEQFLADTEATLTETEQADNSILEKELYRTLVILMDSQKKTNDNALQLLEKSCRSCIKQIESEKRIQTLKI